MTQELVFSARLQDIVNDLLVEKNAVYAAQQSVIKTFIEVATAFRAGWTLKPITTNGVLSGIEVGFLGDFDNKITLECAREGVKFSRFVSVDGSQVTIKFAPALLKGAHHDEKIARELVDGLGLAQIQLSISEPIVSLGGGWCLQSEKEAIFNGINQKAFEKLRSCLDGTTDVQAWDVGDAGLTMVFFQGTGDEAKFKISFAVVEEA